MITNKLYSNATSLSNKLTTYARKERLDLQNMLTDKYTLIQDGHTLHDIPLPALLSKKIAAEKLYAEARQLELLIVSLNKEINVLQSMDSNIARKSVLLSLNTSTPCHTTC